MLIRNFAKALHNLLLPGILKLFLVCLAAYAVSWIIMAWLLGTCINILAHTSLGTGFLVHMLAGFGGWLAAWFLFPLVYPILVSFFDDKMAEVIEREDYPQLPPAQPPFWPTIGHDALFFLKAVGLNILCLPFYLIPPIGVVVYYALNGYLLGTQFFRMAAGRRVSHSEAEALRQKARGSIFISGVLISFCATIPLLNLIAPLLGVATMLHLFHALKGNDRQEILLPR